MNNFKELISYIAGSILTVGIILIIIGKNIEGISLILISMALLVFVLNKNYNTKNKVFDNKSVSNNGEKNVVIIGGGTGLPNMLRGFKEVTSNLTAVVTVGDNGGSSGKLRESLGVLPPGDVRNCILALSNKENSLSEIMSYRFEDGDLKDQNLGNLIIAGMEKTYGCFGKAVKNFSEIFAITGEVLPVSLENLNLIGHISDGTIIKGESQITEYVKANDLFIEKIEICPENPKASNDVIDRILNADVVILGPGSLYTSIIPNLLVDEVKNAIVTTNAKKIFVSNIMTQKGETTNYSLKHHLETLNNYIDIEKIDYVLSNNEMPNNESLKSYMDEMAEYIEISDDDKNFLSSKNIELISGNFLVSKEGQIRHNSEKVAKKVIEII